MPIKNLDFCEEEEKEEKKRWRTLRLFDWVMKFCVADGLCRPNFLSIQVREFILSWYSQNISI
jgi:hypothetical protein